MGLKLQKIPHSLMLILALVVSAKAYSVELIIKEALYNDTVEQGISPEVLQADQTLLWVKAPPMLPASENAWVKIIFEAKNVSAGEELILEMTEDIPRKARFSLLTSQGEILSQSVIGSAVPISLWKNKDYVTGHRFDLSHDGRYTIIAQLKTAIQMPYGIEIKTLAKYKEDESNRKFLLALSLGGIGALLLHYLLLWRSLGRLIFLKAAGLTASFLAFVFCVSGFGVYLSSGLNTSFVHLNAFIPYLAFAQLLSFSLDYLRVRASNHLSVKIVKLCCQGVYMAGFLTYFSASLADYLLTSMFTLGSAMLLGMLFKMSRKGQKHAMLLLAAYVPLFAVFVAWGSHLELQKFISYRSAIPIALFFMVLLIATGMASRLTEIRNQLLSAMKDRARDLEFLVSQKTQEINQKNQDLLTEIEERKRAEQIALEQKEMLQAAQSKIISSSRLTALGEMATGISHEINNPLTILKGYSFLMQDCLKSPQTSAEKLSGLIQKSLITMDRMSNVIRGLREFSLQEQGDDPIDISISECCDTVWQICKTRVNSLGIKLDVSAIDNGLYGVARPADLVQVLLSCISNSCDALSSGKDGWIKVSTHSDADHIVLRIEDSGSGISESVASNIFTPFCTTKRRSEISGLSLSIGKQLMLSAGGDVRYLAGEKNTTFEIVVLKATRKEQVTA